MRMLYNTIKIVKINKSGGYKMILVYKKKNQQEQKTKNPKQLERIFKGISNHRRIEIILMINKNPGITLVTIAQQLDCNIKTIAEHTRKLVIAGLVNKKYIGSSVAHQLSPYGVKIIKVIEKF